MLNFTFRSSYPKTLGDWKWGSLGFRFYLCWRCLPDSLFPQSPEFRCPATARAQCLQSWTDLQM